VLKLKIDRIGDLAGVLSSQRAVRALQETRYDVTINMSPHVNVALFFLDYRRAKDDNMVKLVIMGDVLINQGVFYAGR
jgi:hypothetical protein